MRNSRQITVLRSLFKTLHPILESGLAPARRLLTSTQEPTAETTSNPEQPNAAPPNRASHASATRTSPLPAASTPKTTSPNVPPDTQPTGPAKGQPKHKTAPLDRTLTDEHLVVELDNITRQISMHGHTAHAPTSKRASPQRSQRHYSRDTLLALLQEAKVRIQVLETELELARGFDETIPMLTEEWQDDESEQQD